LDVLGFSLVFANDLSRDELSRFNAGAGLVVANLAGAREADLASTLASAPEAGRWSVGFASGAARVTGLRALADSWGFRADVIVGLATVTGGRWFVRRCVTAFSCAAC